MKISEITLLLIGALTLGVGSAELASFGAFVVAGIAIGIVAFPLIAIVEYLQSKSVPNALVAAIVGSILIFVGAIGSLIVVAAIVAKFAGIKVPLIG